MLQVNTLSGFGIGSTTDIPYTYNTVLQSNTSASSYEFNDAFIGQALANRMLVLYVTLRASTNIDFNSVVVNAVSANQIVESFGQNGGITWRTALYTAILGSNQQTATVTVNMSGTTQRCTVGIWSLYGYSSTPKSSGTKSSTAFPAINFAARDIGIFGQYGYNTQVNWTNATVNYNQLDTSGGDYVSGASYRATSAENRTVSNDISTVDTYACYAVFGTS